MSLGPHAYFSTEGDRELTAHLRFFPLAVSPFSVNDFFMSYIMIPVFILMAGGYKLYHKTKFADLATADLGECFASVCPATASLSAELTSSVYNFPFQPVNGRRHFLTTSEVEGEAPNRSFASKLGAKIVG